MKNKVGLTQIFTWVSVLMILVMIVMMFTPSWKYETKERGEDRKMVTVTKEASIAGFVWFPEDHKGLVKNYENETDTEFVINDEVTMPALLLVLGVALSIFALVKSKSLIGPLAAFGLGAYSIYGYHASDFIKTASCWNRNVTVSYIATAVGLVCIVAHIVVVILKKKAAKV